MTAVTSKRRDAGFTLLELLLALGLLTLITSTVLGGLHLGRRAWETGRNYEARGEIEAAALAISNLLERSFPAMVVEGNDHLAVVFNGRPDGCFFIALSEGETQRGGLILTEIGLLSEAGRTDLAVWTKVFRAETALQTGRADMREAEALRDLASFDLAYFGVVEQNRAPVWVDSWVSHDRLPQLISVRLAAKRKGRRVETSFFVALPQQ